MTHALQPYVVEWEDADGYERECMVNARTASEAHQKAVKELSSRKGSDFVQVIGVELYP